jgi:hypothetical protein
MPRVTPIPIPALALVLSPRVVVFDTAGVMTADVLCQLVEERLAVVIVTSDGGEDRAFNIVGDTLAAEYEEQTGLMNQISLAVKMSVPSHVVLRQGCAEFQIIADSAPH